jgi:hypothetical protein
MLGVASSALWDFVKWSIEHVDIGQFEHLFGNLFYLNVPMGSGRLNVRSIMEQDLRDENYASKDEDRMLTGISNLLNDDDARSLAVLFERWTGTANV